MFVLSAYTPFRNGMKDLLGFRSLVSGATHTTPLLQESATHAC